MRGFLFFPPFLFLEREGFCFFPFYVSEERGRVREGADGLEGGGQLASVLISRTHLFWKVVLIGHTYLWVSNKAHLSVMKTRTLNKSNKKLSG